MHTVSDLNLDQFASNIGPNGLNIAYQRAGDPQSPAVVLIVGLAAQSIHWPDPFCGILLENGLQVIRFDNRDSGLSTHLQNAPTPNLPAALAGDHSSASYNLSDMAADTAGLLDALGIASAHLVGASMGAQIAQTFAIEYPHRTRSLVSMMSTTGAPGVGQADPDVLRELFAGPPAVTRDQVIEMMLRAARIAGSPGFPADEADVAARAGRAFDRGWDPLSIARQAVATVVSGDRTERLRQLRIPALVMHGLADRMCDPSGGRATAGAITGAELLEIEGMGHGFAPGLYSQLATSIVRFIRRTEVLYSGQCLVRRT